MGIRQQEDDSLLTIYDSQDERRVTFHSRADGTVGFQEWKFLLPESSWVPTRIGDGSRLATLQDAIEEAKGRVLCRNRYDLPTWLDHTAGFAWTQLQ
jgi:hypothetical protein